MKKVLLTTLILIILLVIGGAIYFYFAREQAGIEDGQEGERATFNPFGFLSGDEDEFKDNEIENPVTAEDENVGFAGGPLDKFQKIADGPVAGVMSGVKNGSDVFRYVERETGHIFDAYATSTKINRITNTTVPRIQNALFGNLDTVVLQYLADDAETILSFSASVVPKSATSTDGFESLSGVFLPQGIQDLSFGDSGSVFYITDSGTGYVSSVDDTNVEQIVDSPISGWITQWGGGNSVALTSKPSFGIGGVLVSLNTNTGAQSTLFSGISALTTNTDQSFENIAFSGSSDDFALRILHTQDGSVVETILSTLPEKCVWGSDLLYCAVPQNLGGLLPDAWYQGTRSFNDSLFSVEPQTGSVTFLFGSQQLEETFDMTHMTLSPSENHLSFINKKDGSLWVYDLGVEENQEAEADALEDESVEDDSL